MKTLKDALIDRGAKAKALKAAASAHDESVTLQAAALSDLNDAQTAFDAADALVNANLPDGRDFADPVNPGGVVEKVDGKATDRPLEDPDSVEIPDATPPADGTLPPS